MRSTTLALITSALLALCGAATASADASWLTTDASSALQQHNDKVSSQFHERLRYALPDGTLRVMVALDRRDAEVEAFAAAFPDVVARLRALRG